MASLHPTHGARMVLEREDGEPVRYRVSVYEPSVVHVGTASVEGALVRFSGWSSEPPAWTIVFVERTLKGLAKKGDWPRKMTRWREERG